MATRDLFLKVEEGVKLADRLRKRVEELTAQLAEAMAALQEEEEANDIVSGQLAAANASMVDLTARLEEVFEAGNVVTNYVNAQGGSVAERLDNVVEQVTAAVQNGVEAGASAAFAAAFSIGNLDVREHDLAAPVVQAAMEENAELFLAEASEVAEVVGTDASIMKLFE